MSTDPTAGASGRLTTTQWLILTVAAIGFLFDTYELLMFPVTGSQALSELLKVPPDSDAVRLWAGRMLWIAALCGGIFGLLGGWLIDRLGRKTVMVIAIFMYSFSPVAASFSTSLEMLVVFRCTTFIGVCVELVAAVTWLSEVFEDKRRRQLAIGWTLAFASVGGILVTEVFKLMVQIAPSLPTLPLPEGFNGNAAWRYTLLTGLIPGALILVLMPFVPESRVWLEKKRAGTLRRPKFRELFAPDLRRTTLVATGLSACAYAAAFGALQLTPLQMVPGLPDIAAKRAEIAVAAQDAAMPKKLPAKGSAEFMALTPAQKEVAARQAELRTAIDDRRGNIQRWQEIGGLVGRILLAVLLVIIASHGLLLRSFVLPGVVMFPLTYVVLINNDYTLFAMGVFLCGLMTVAQFSYFGEYLPKAFPLHLRGTGGSFATNIGGRMFGTMAAFLNTELLAPMFDGDNPTKVAKAAACVGGGAFVIALVLSFLLPAPKDEKEGIATPSVKS